MRTVKQQRRAPGEENNERVNTATKKKGKSLALARISFGEGAW